MEHICFEGMPLPLPVLMDERSSTMNLNMASSLSTSTLLLESFHTQQQQQNPNSSYTPQQFNPAVSWSTTDSTLLLTDREQKRAEGLLNSRGSGGGLKLSSDSIGDDDMGNQASCCGGLSSFPTVQLQQTRSSTDFHHHAGLNDSVVVADQIVLHGDMIIDGRSSGCGNTISRSSSASSVDPFSFCGGGGGDGSGGGVNASSQSQWMEQMCSLSSDQCNSCVDALMMPRLDSDPSSESPQRQQESPCVYYMTSSTSVNCLHDAESCGNSDRDRSTSSEETHWVNNKSDVIQQQHGGSGCIALPNLRVCGGGGGGDSMAGWMLSSVKLPDEYSSSIAAAADDVELLNYVRHHRHGSTCGSTTTAVECAAAAAAPPSGRVSWMSPGIGNSVRKSNDVTTLDPLLLLGSAAAAASPTQQPHLQMISNNGLLPAATRTVLASFKTQQQQAYTLNSLPTSVLPLFLSTSKNCSGSSMISPSWCRSLYPSLPPLIDNAGMLDNCTTTTSSGSFYKDFHSLSNRQQHQSSSVQAAAGGVGGAGVREFNVGGGRFESRREFGSDQLPLLSASRKPNAPSIEPQSVTARHRRKKISERVRILEKLIPQGNKMDTASMLDEAIEFVKFLQLQVQLLESMGEPEPLHMHSNTTIGATTSITMTTTTSNNNNNNTSSAFHHSKVHSNALIGGGFGSSHNLSRSAALMQNGMQKVTIAAARVTTTTTKSTTRPPLILSEVLQEQLFKQKLCLVSLRQYCPQQQARPSC